MDVCLSSALRRRSREHSSFYCKERAFVTDSERRNRVEQTPRETRPQQTSSKNQIYQFDCRTTDRSSAALIVEDILMRFISRASLASVDQRKIGPGLGVWLTRARQCQVHKYVWSRDQSESRCETRESIPQGNGLSPVVGRKSGWNGSRLSGW